MSALKRTRTADELVQYINGTLEDEDYLLDMREALYSLSIKDFYKGREAEEMMLHFQKKVKKNIKTVSLEEFSELEFGEALLAAEEAGEIKGDCLVTLFMLLCDPVLSNMSF